MENQIDVTRALKPEGVRQRYGIPKQSLAKDRHMNRGIPYVKLGKSVYYNIADIEAYFLSNRIVPGK